MMEFTPTEVILKRAKAAASCPALRDTEAKNRALAAMAQELRAEAPAILAENAADLEASRGKVPDVMLDRLALNEARLEGMAAGIEAVAALPDPVGRTLDEFVRPDGLRICKRSVPMGVIAIIYESRPERHVGRRRARAEVRQRLRAALRARGLPLRRCHHGSAAPAGWSGPV